MNPTVRPLSTMLSALLLATLISCAQLPPRQATWNDSYQTRVAALALLQTLNADLLSHDSATLTLPDGTPISEVVETYTGKVLAFPPPAVARPAR